MSPGGDLRCEFEGRRSHAQLGDCRERSAWVVWVTSDEKWSGYDVSLSCGRVVVTASIVLVTARVVTVLTMPAI